MSKKASKKIENEVISNSGLVEARFSSYFKEHENEYLIFNSGKEFFTKSFAEALKKGEKEFGEDTGFVVRKVSKQVPVLSALVKL